MLDKQQVEFFHQNGYLMVDGLYNQQQIDQLEEAYNASIPGRMRDFTHGNWKKNEPEVTAVYGLHDVQRFHPNWTYVGSPTFDKGFSGFDGTECTTPPHEIIL
mgnify:CR=1 FL=1